MLVIDFGSLYAEKLTVKMVFKHTIKKQICNLIF